MSNYVNGSPNNTNTLADIIQINDQNLADFESSELFQPTPFFNLLQWTPASHGTAYKWLVESGAPGAAFREINEGISNAAGSEYLKTLLSLKYLDASFDRDVALLRCFWKQDGARRLPSARNDEIAFRRNGPR